MFWSKKVEVTFIDADSGQTVAASSLAADQLPESFEAHTTVTLRGESWEVLEADPVTREECAKRRALRLTVRRMKATDISPGELLFSLPSICDRIPAIQDGTSKLGKNVLELHEDDWRQVELVSSANRQEAGACLNRIREIYETQRAPSRGFKSIHVRKEVASPLQGSTLTMAALRSALPMARALDGLGYRGVAGLIQDGFALEAPGVTAFGLERDQKIEACCLDLRADPAWNQHVPRLAALMAECDLFLVDWCRVHLASASETALKAYLEESLEWTPDRSTLN